MSQTHAAQKPASLGAAAAAAVTPAASNAKPAETKPADAKPADNKPAEGGEAAKKVRGSKRVFIVVGQIHEFETTSKAEKFLNGEGAPTEYTVLKGVRVGTNKKVSLR